MGSIPPLLNEMRFSHKPQLLMHRDHLQQPCPWPASSKHAERAAPPAANRRGLRLGHASKRPEQRRSTPSHKGVSQEQESLLSFIIQPVISLPNSCCRSPITPRPSSILEMANVQLPPIPSSIPSRSSPSPPFRSLHPTPCAHAVRTDVSLSSPLSNASCKKE